MKLTESRRLTGPNLISQNQGAVIDVAFDEADRSRIEASWRHFAESMLTAVQLGRCELHVRSFQGGASFVIGGPIDILYAICEINEWAWAQCCAEVTGQATEPSSDAAPRFIALMDEERNPRITAIQDEAHSKKLGFLWDDDEGSVGYGTGSRTWPVGSEPDDIGWDKVHDIPILMVTGTNGKTTTIRMLASIMTAWGKTPGFSSTDGLWVGSELIDSGDYSGPGGARTVLRDTRTEIALLETARGGMLRRGLGIHRADAAAVAILNIAEDHMGEYGIEQLDDLVEAKFVIRKGLAPNRPIILNADNAQVIAGAKRYIEGTIIWFSLDPQNPVVRSHLDQGGSACYLDDKALIIDHEGSRTEVTTIDRVPATFDGHARYNISNALAAVSLAFAHEVPTDAIAKGLLDFASDTSKNLGRGNRFEVKGATAIVDYSHNPHGMQAFLEMANLMPAKRRLLTLGQAGDRDDQAIRDLVGTVWAARPDIVVIKEIHKYLRGREPGSVTAVMKAEFLRLGAPASAIVCRDSEVDAVAFALDWAQEGDLLLLSVLEQRDAVIEMLRQV